MSSQATSTKPFKEKGKPNNLIHTHSYVVWRTRLWALKPLQPNRLRKR